MVAFAARIRSLPVATPILRATENINSIDKQSALPGCPTQTRTEEELVERLHEAVELAVEERLIPLRRAS
jgi:hypothetical protein